MSEILKLLYKVLSKKDVPSLINQIRDSFNDPDSSLDPNYIKIDSLDPSRKHRFSLQIVMDLIILSLSIEQTYDLAKILIDNGANPCLSSSYTPTPYNKALYRAFALNDIQFFKLFLKNVPKDVQLDTLKTCFEYIVIRKVANKLIYEMIEFLLLNGVDPNISFSSGKLPLEYIVICHDTEMLKDVITLLINNGAKNLHMCLIAIIKDKDNDLLEWFLTNYGSRREDGCELEIYDTPRNWQISSLITRKPIDYTIKSIDSYNILKRFGANILTKEMIKERRNTSEVRKNILRYELFPRAKNQILYFERYFLPKKNYEFLLEGWPLINTLCRIKYKENRLRKYLSWKENKFLLLFVPEGPSMDLCQYIFGKSFKLIETREKFYMRHILKESI